MKRETVLTLVYGVVIGLLAGGIIWAIGAARPQGVPVVLLDPPTPRPLRVHVLGAVATPGVYALPAGSIWQDAVNAAGGATTHADLAKLNLAQIAVDGDQIVVPEITPTPLPTRAPSPSPIPSATRTSAPTVTTGPGTPSPTPLATPKATSVSTSTGGETSVPSGPLINLNTATSEELQTLPRIGPAIAQRIIDYRTAHGAFKAIEDIMNVKGIGPATFAQIKDLITVGP